ncbi:polysaccharide biosynthesis C-terminal domain-containing protein [uncultured Sunxiuqinia sp.]|uniref:lipopolysaccharide biosynthesis protein n=1 Tax=uncultured Sunxiuqinia sp. TaxID=1573825 RepID=UPI0026356803|nr:polysaccharide biosynthesis C-terminal domain-containing protein [uncultured Sunxiuqinia sp.]
MGIIIKQSIKGSIWSYLGVAIGFVTTTYLYTEYLTTELVGLFGLLAAYAALTGQFFLLGFQGVTSRLFPYFRNPGTGHNGFLFLGSLVFILGFALFLATYYSFKPLLIESNLEKSTLFANYVHLLIPLTFFSMAFVFLDAYNRMLYDAVTGTFLQEFIQRLLLFIIVVLYAVGLISLNALIWLYTAAVCAKGLLLLLFLWRKGEIHIQSRPQRITPELKKEIRSVAFYSILASLGGIFVFNIDKIAVNQLLDLSNTGVYTIAFYFGTLVVIPSRPLLKISGTLIADAWQRNDLAQIKDIYYKSCINQLIIGGFLFLGIWANIDNILTILGDDYIQSKWVIFFIGLGYLFDMLTGANAQVIAYSKYYRVALVFIVILILLVITLLYLLIPVWGITGAGIAVAAALFANNLMRFIFLYQKYKLQPFNIHFLFVAAFFTGLYFLTSLIPQQALIVDLVLRGGIITLTSAAFIFLVPVSPDLRNLAQKLFKMLIG